MENLNAEQVKKALECCALGDCTPCPYHQLYVGCRDRMAEDSLALINSQEQKIFELKNRLKECENGYEGTLYLDRCKLHDAEEKIKELTEENERLRADTLLKYGEKVYQLIWGFVGEKLSEQDKDYITVRLGQIAKEMLEGE